MTQQTRYGPVATHLRFENEHVRVWEMDLAPGQICGLHRHTLDYVLYILEGGRIAVESPGMTSNRFPGQTIYELEVGARTISYVPAGGAESARNISGAGRFREALFEIRRPLPHGVANPGFALTEAAVRTPPERGDVMLLENSRIRALEVTLAPGDTAGPRAHLRDTAVFVIEGGRVRQSETRDGNERAHELELASNTVLWQPGGSERELTNVGSQRYRELRVEFR
jgi:predicted metal-dependent enzyme (double-stranded beta helix superfamily)